MNKLFFVIILLVSCSGRESKKVEIKISANKDSLLIENLMEQQKFDTVKKKIDSILPLKVVADKGYYFYQKGFACLMSEEFIQAISNFEQAISLGYEVKASKSMIESAKEMKEQHDKYN